MAILRELALDADGDLALVAGRLSFLEGSEALAQRISVRLQTIKGEWVFDTLIGTPWFQQILGGRAKSRLGLIQQLLTQRIAETEGVDRVLELTVNFDSQIRELEVTGRVVAEGGSTVPISLEFG